MPLPPFRRACVIACKSARILTLGAAMLSGAGAARADWSLDGVPVCTAPDMQDASWTVAGDALFVVWQDIPSSYYTTYRVHAQRLDANGQKLWSANGASVAAGTSDQHSPMAVSDGEGGVIVAFQSGVDLYAQRLDANGVPQWGASGVLIATGSLTNRLERLRGLISDGATPVDGSPAGAILLWTDGPWYPQPPDTKLTFTVRAQSIDGFGILRWPAAGVQVSADTAGGDGVAVPRTTALIVSDGIGVAGEATGAFIAWRSRDGDVISQRLSADGVPYWAEGGVALTDLRSAAELAMVRAAPGQAIVLWSDVRSDIFARQLTPTGPRWSADGVPVGGGLGVPVAAPQAVPDGSDGVIVSWMDARQFSTNGYDIYAQRLDADGLPLWTSGGVPVCTQPRDQFGPVVAPDDRGGMIAVWTDSPRGSGNTMLDIYAQHLTSAGGPAAGHLLIANPMPNPSPGPTTFEFALPSAQRLNAAVYGVDGALVRTLMGDLEMASGRGSLHWDGRDEHERPARSGVYFMRLRAGSEVQVRKVVVTR